MIRLVLERPGLVPVLMAFNQPVVVVGRGTAGDGGPEVDWRLPFADVSRRQCRFSQVAERTYVEGLSPRNPTRVNQREAEGLTRVHPGDQVSFGGCVVRLAGEDARERTPMARLPAAPRPAVREPAREVEAVSEDMSQMLERASRWAAHGQPPALLLGGAELRRGRAWLRGGAELGEAGALARRYVEASLRTRRARAQRAVAAAAAVVLAIGGGSATARGVLGPWTIEPVVGAGRPFEDGCRRDALVKAEEVLQAARAEGDSDDGLLMSAYALRIAERGGCVSSSRAEAALRESLAGRRGRVVGRHAAAISAVAIGGEGGAIASADARGRVRLWDGTGGPAIELGEGDGPTERLAFSADGRWLVAGGGAGELRVWDLRSEARAEPRRLAGHRAAVVGIAFDAAGALLATSDRRGVLRLWDMSGETGGRSIGVHVEAAGAVEELVFEAGRLFGRAGGRVLAWRVYPPGAERRLGAREGLPSAGALTAFAVVGERVITGDVAGELTVWRTGRTGWTGRSAGRHRGPVARVRAVAGRQAAVSLGRDGGLMLVELAAPVRRDGTPLVYAFAPLARSADDLVVETGGRRALTVGDELAVWDLAQRRAEPIARLGEGRVTAVAGAGAWAAAGGEDGVVRAWDLRVDGGSAGASPLTDHGSEVVSLALAGGGTALASAGRDEAVRVWRVDRDGVPTAYAVLRPQRAVDRVVLSEDGRWLAGSSGRALHLWDLEAIEREPVELIGHAEAIRELRFAGSGWLASLDSTGEIHFWRMTPAGPEPSSRRTSLPHGVWALAASDEHMAVGTGSSDGGSGRTYVWPLGEPWDEEARIAEHSRPVTALAFSADGRLVASGSADGGVRTAIRGEERWRAGRPYDHGQSVRALAFARDAGVLAIGGADGGIALHEPEAGGEPRRFVAHTAAITGLAFGTDRGRLVSAGQDGALTSWRLGDREEPWALPLVGHRGPIFELLADREGRVVVTAGDDATVRVWPLEPAGLVRLACMAVGRDLAPEVWRRALPGFRPEALCAGADGW